jgi:hypothetical protein
LQLSQPPALCAPALAQQSSGSQVDDPEEITCPVCRKAAAGDRSGAEGLPEVEEHAVERTGRCMTMTALGLNPSDFGMAGGISTTGQGACKQWRWQPVSRGTARAAKAPLIQPDGSRRLNPMAKSAWRTRPSLAHMAIDRHVLQHRRD